MLNYFFQILFGKKGDIIKNYPVFSGSYGGRISINKILLEDVFYLDVVIDWRAYNRIRIGYDFFLKKKSLFVELKEIISSGAYREMKYNRIDVPPISSYINLGGFKENVCRKFLLICNEKQIPIIELYICSHKDKYYIVFNINDSMAGNRRVLNIEDGLKIANALISIADDL